MIAKGKNIFPMLDTVPIVRRIPTITRDRYSDYAIVITISNRFNKRIFNFILSP